MWDELEDFSGWYFVLEVADQLQIHKVVVREDGWDTAY